jgi:hypothetical protein
MDTEWDAIGLDAPAFARARHLCAFFHAVDEQYRVLIPFIKEGYDRNEKGCHIVNPESRDEHLRRLNEAGIPIEKAITSGRIEVHCWDDVYIHKGRFDAGRKLAFIKDALQRGRAEGYRRTRLIGEVERKAHGRPDSRVLVEYEARLTALLVESDDYVICVYDIQKFGAGVLLDFLRTHPLIIVDEVMHVNPFFVMPATFLRELRARPAKASGAVTSSAVKAQK